MNIIEQIEQEQITRLSEERPVPEFAPGDTVRVYVKVTEGTRERVQVFEGVCIGRRNAGVNSSFTVRKISYGEGVERVFPLHSPRIEKIEVVRRGAVRRAKLYYLRGLRGKRARIKEKVERRVGKGVVAEEGEVAAASDEVVVVEEEQAPEIAEEATAEATAEAPSESGDEKKDED